MKEVTGEAGCEGERREEALSALGNVFFLHGQLPLRSAIAKLIKKTFDCDDFKDRGIHYEKTLLLFYLSCSFSGAYYVKDRS